MEPRFSSQKITNQKNFSIDISELLSFYETLAADEKNEQLLDWALYGLVSQLNIPSDKASDILQNDLPMRYPYLKSSIEKEISPGRIKYIDGNDCIVIVQRGKSDEKSLVGNIIDKKFAETNSVPKSVHIFEYSVDFSSGLLNIFYIKTVSDKRIFSDEYNYFEKEIKTLDDFKDFAEGKTDDITKVQWKEKSVVFGGRKYSDNSDRSLFLEDIAALYQAYNMPFGKEKEKQYRNDYENFINQKYEELIRNDKKLRKAISSGTVAKSQVLDDIRKKIPYIKPSEQEAHIGFSLDTGINYAGISDDLLRVSKKDVQFVNPQDKELNALIDSFTDKIISSAEKIKKQFALEPFLIMRRKFASSKEPGGHRFDDLLQHIEMKNSYQYARYDGLLQGSPTGMILFYTDLTAKLWALDYKELAPKNYITGFRTMSEIKVPKLYWADFVKLSKTRLWFGLRQEGFEIYGNKLLFAPTATRVYAASSNPLFPGKETKPNFQSAEFLGWWDMHYPKVAEYEPQYHKLNQIQKWGCIFTVLKEENSRLLDFLFEVPVTRNLNFETWYKNTDSIKIKTDIPFEDRNRHNKKTECLELLSSRDYPLMGQRFFLYGGVSLASRKDIIGKLSKKQTSYKTAKNKTKKLVEKPASAQKITSADVSKIKQSGRVAANQRKLELNYKFENLNYGNFSAEKRNNEVKLKWEKGTYIILNDIVNTLVSIQEKRQPGYKDENIFGSLSNIEKIIRLEQWAKYLIKSKDIKNSWIYLKMNEPEKKFRCIVEAAATEQDSDIFYAYLLTDDQKNKLVSDKRKIDVIFSK
ncbi:MAG: hypothetical protein HY919_03160 [Elusimicrobia bacterium]|nr:hypothetical protein [Elusimicrobiota bacterium]